MLQRLIMAMVVAMQTSRVRSYVFSNLPYSCHFSFCPNQLHRSTYQKTLTRTRITYKRLQSPPTRLFGTKESSLLSDTDSSLEKSVPVAPELLSPSQIRYTGTVTVLDQGQHHLVVAKPPSVLCHHSGWAGSRKKKKDQEPEIPMLQRVRQALQGRRVNVIHRLDRGCSGCLLFAYAEDDNNSNDTENEKEKEDIKLICKNNTAILSDALGMKSTTKTYVALVRGEGILHGRDFKQEGWFEVSRPIKNERGNLQNATTFFRFVAGQASIGTELEQPRASLVLARPLTGKWHQIRRHLNGLSHPILGDSSHGISKVNREWKERGMPAERTCLHLARLQMEPTTACPDGIDASCPLPDDMMDMLKNHLPNVLKDAAPILEEEGIVLNPNNDNSKALPYEFVINQSQ
ncbi:tRNA pseudouridine synthase C [Seminavis robusta]|uniref:tRNA pseudouridine synthase C n=1 Tax=Seminavis robusta TaxID=568900 RepID=A0A9N8DIT8_9STRA|nr:tRNA pseudouridine synthase C [Seminavis robusta]|eukprot:Sro84_g045020.1 tRNA pseudouridine synthase C (404) ;mRNA; r:105038-106249